ncbi:hypothetical protein IMG5_051420 [Ichthyophthirius multifiliis]|uniref:Uncharacterized protein n=1 Tax=Ichthyophthirius multifiliis TaxID=5932 RepID=G0QMR1_ICHMU|nr:hypothetical protein IMG5_051420 [Ichthyophthirius multifiliis]EGR33464.1 hypothetical protein IMG5_051420 [Ichthyophthirius multifiliis]|eukprot:XP_004037450.1 hypothetical protein IMG5_051420 [Ichthyophthirius multifiliis]
MIYLLYVIMRVVYLLDIILHMQKIDKIKNGIFLMIQKLLKLIKLKKQQHLFFILQLYSIDCY